MKLFVLNGPNLNMLGKREQQHYGTQTLAEIESQLAERFPEVTFTFRQSNSEGEMVEIVQDLVTGPFDGLIANFAAYTHTSIALRDALSILEIPKIEVHLSNIHAREEFRKRSVTGEVCDGLITGFGAESYALAVFAIKSKLED